MTTNVNIVRENEQLRKKLMQAKSVIGELREELKEQEKVRYKITEERDRYRNKILDTKQAIKKVDDIVAVKTAEAIQLERDKFYRTEQDLIQTKNRLRDLERRHDEIKGINLEYDDRFKDLKADYDFLEGNTGGDALALKMREIKELKDENRKKLQDLKDLSDNLEDILAENRILRKMNNIPDNWGCEPQKRIIKLQDRETVFEYKRLVKVLQEDNYNLEKERARLKHQLKQMAIYGSLSSIDEIRDLTPEQRLRILEFITKIRRGETDDEKSWYELHEENKRLRHELEILQTKGYNVIRQQLEAFFRDNKDSFFKGGMDTSEMTEQQKKMMEAFNKQQKKMQDMVDIMSKGKFANVFPTNGNQDEFAISQQDAYRFGPPRVTGMTTGFSSKFGTNMSIPLGGATNPKDLPALQLQCVELFGIVERKDGLIKRLETELERAYAKVRKYLLMQDQLYLNYVEQYQEFKNQTKKLKDEKRELTDQLHTQQILSDRDRKSIKDLRLDPESKDNLIINLNKKLALLEVENFKLAKKYNIICEQEKQLRDAYHKIEEGFTDRERYATERITKLKEWQIKAINEIKFLYSKFKDAVPLGQYQTVSRELFIYKHKFADSMEKNNKQAVIISNLQTKHRQMLEAGEKLKLYEELTIDVENELEYTKKRLEIVDPSYRLENAIFNRVIAVLKQKHLSPHKAFAIFDKDGNGRLDDREFMSALHNLGVDDLNPKEKEMLKRAIDQDESGSIDYKEFCRKCSRHGVLVRTREDEIVYVLDQALKRSGTDLGTMFEIMDKKGNGVITKEDFKDTLRNVNIDRKDLEAFVDMFWKGRDEGINYRDFIRIYNKFKVKFHKEGEDDLDVKGRYQITDEMIKRIKWVFDNMNKIFKEQQITLKQAFDRIDNSGDKEITRVELRDLFDRMGVSCTDKELDMVFESMDIDNSGAITYNEFKLEFERIVETDEDILLALNNRKKTKTYKVFSDEDITPINDDLMNSSKYKDATKISFLSTKVKHLEGRANMYLKDLEDTQNSKIKWKRSYENLDRKFNELNEKYLKILDEEQVHNNQKIGTLSKDRSEKLVLETEKQKEMIVDMQAAMSSYKNLFEVAAGQAKTLKLANKRGRDEEENLLFALRELQSNSIDKMKLGRIYYILMLSRWQEAAIGMKYDYALNDVRTLRLEYSVVEARLREEEEGRRSSENKLRVKCTEVIDLQQAIESIGASGITMARAEEISKELQEISDDKADVEEKYITLFSQINSKNMELTEYKIRMEQAEQLLTILKNATDSELSDRLIEMSDKLLQIRRSELRSKRESEENSEKVIYSEKRLGQQRKRLVDLEEEVAKLESDLHRKEEEWRRADNERQKKFFEMQYVNFETENRYKGYVDDSKVREKYPKDKLIAPPVGEFLIKKEDVRIMQAKIRNQEDEISSLRAQIVSKEKQLDRLREWQLEDNLLSEDEKLRDIIDSNKVKIDQMHEDEQKEIARAASKTIKALKEIIENKDAQNNRKEEIIKELKDRMTHSKQEDTKEIIRLNDELNEAKKAQSTAEHTFHQTDYKLDERVYEAYSRKQLLNLCHEKDNQLQRLQDDLTRLDKANSNLLHNMDDRERNTLMRGTDEMADEQSRKLAGLRRHIDTLTKKLDSKKRIEDRLNDTVREITDKLVRLEQMKGLTDEDRKFIELTKKDDHPEKDGVTSKTEQLQKELEAKEKRLIRTNKRIKAFEKSERDMQEQVLKLKEAEKHLQTELTASISMRQKLVDQHQNEIREQKKKERLAKKGAEETKDKSSGLEVKVLMKQMQRENNILKTQTKPVIAYNNENKAFEYIGEPVALRDDDKPCETVEEFINRTKEWLKVNHRVTVAQIFNSFDFNKSGYMEKDLLTPIFSRLGIKIHEKEVNMIFECLNKDDPDLCKYRPLVLQITTGPDQLEFLPKCCVEVGEYVVKKDLKHNDILSAITVDHRNDSTKKELADGLDKCFPDEITKDLIDQCFTTFKVKGEHKVDSGKLVDTIFKASLAICINKIKKVFEEKGREYARDAREDKLEETKGLSLDNEFSKIDKEHDADLTFAQFDQLLDVYEIKDIKQNCRDDIKNLLDLDKTNKITLFYIKQIFDLPRGDSHFGMDMKPSKDFYKDQEDFEIAENAKRALKHIYQNDNLLEKLGTQINIYDNDKDGVMHRNILQQSIKDVTKDAHQDDVDYIVQFADKRNKGYFNPEIFMDNIVKIAHEEAKKDAILRRLHNVIKHKGIDLQKELMKQSKNNSGVLDTYDFMRAMRELRIGLDGNDMEDLVQFATQGEKYVDIKRFCKMVEDAAKFKPIIVTAPNTKKSDLLNKKGELSEKEQKKIHQKIQALTNQLLDTKKELEKVEKNAADWKAIAEKNEKSLNVLSDKLLDPKDRLKRMGEIGGDGTSAKSLKMQLRQQERILELGQKLEDLHAKNEDLAKHIEIDVPTKISEYRTQTEMSEKKYKAIKSENISLQNQIDKLVSATSAFDKNEEAEYARQLITKNLEERIRELESGERDMHEELLKLEHQTLDMKFDRENNNHKQSRLKDRINDLENYIEIYTQLPASMIDKANKNKDFDLEKELAKRPGTSKRSAAELEKVIEGLKRVINTQKAELEQHKKKDSKFKKKDDKVSTNKMLKDEIDNLEKEIQAVEIKDKEIAELSFKNDKLIDANKALMKDVKNEQKRYEFLEAKFKELLVKYNVTFKDLEKKQDSLFTMSTGANRATYEEYLLHKDNIDKQKNED